MTVESHAELEKRKRDRFEETGLTSMFQVIRQMASDISSVTSELTAVNAAFKSHMVTEEQQRQEVSDRIQALSDKIDEAVRLKEAFPVIDGEPDIHGHKVDHLTRMESSARTNKLLDKVREELVTNAVRGIFLALLIIIGLGVKDWATSFITHVTSSTKTETTTTVDKRS